MARTKRWVLLGCGAQARVAFDIVRALGQAGRIVGCIDAMNPAPGEASLEFPGGRRVRVLAGTRGWREALKAAKATGVVPGLGENVLRRAWAARAVRAGWRLIGAVHPDAVISGGVEMGDGAVVHAGSVVGIDVKLGRGAIVNTGATVDHDCVVGEFAHIAPGAHLAGRVTVGRGALIGVGAAVRQGIRIGDGALVGAGAAVVSDVPAGWTVVGVPARRLRGAPKS